MRIVFFSPGKIKSQELQALLQNYIKLVSRFHECELVELDASKKPGALADESLEKFLSQRGSRVYLTLLDERGKTFTSRDFADKVQKIKDSSPADWVIALGNDRGYSPEMQKKAQFLWSLSPLTFAHELAITLAAEQVFRAFSILSNHPYHRD